MNNHDTSYQKSYILKICIIFSKKTSSCTHCTIIILPCGLIFRPRIRHILVWVFLSRGIPILYYGTEQGLDGHQGPENSKGQDNLRESMWQTGRAYRPVLAVLAVCDDPSGDVKRTMEHGF